LLRIHALDLPDTQQQGDGRKTPKSAEKENAARAHGALPASGRSMGESALNEKFKMPGVAAIAAPVDGRTPRKGGAAGLLKKVRGNAAWNGLSREKRATLEHWLFEDRLSYDAALERAKKELGFTGSRTSLRRFYERMRSERLLSGLTDTGAVARTVEQSDVSVERLRNAGLKLAAEMFLRTVASTPENTKEWAPLAKLL
jgi:hypothetical protein